MRYIFHIEDNIMGATFDRTLDLDCDIRIGEHIGIDGFGESVEINEIIRYKECVHVYSRGIFAESEEYPMKYKQI